MTSIAPIRQARRIQSEHRTALISLAITAQLYRAFNDREEARRAVESRWGKWGRK